MKDVFKYMITLLILMLATPCFIIYVWMQTVLDGSVELLQKLNNNKGEVS